MRTARLPAALAFSLFAATAFADARPIRVSCIGNSITARGYPAKLASRLGPSHVVENHGVSGTTLLKKGDKPYWTQGKLGAVFAFEPDIVTIKLGTNDSKSQNWGPHKGAFRADLEALIDTLSTISTKPKIWLCLPSPSFTTGSDINGAIIRDEIVPIIRQVAEARKLDLIDLQNPLTPYPGLFPDKVHPNEAGSDSIASLIYRSMAAKSERIACIGNSITQYVNTVSGPTHASEAYPARLGMLFGRTHLVQNHGVSGAFAQKESPSPYWNTGRVGQVLAWKPQTITIKLGTNDSRAQNWNRDRYIRDLRSLVDTLERNISPRPRIWLMLPVPAWKRNGVDPSNGISGTTIRDQVIPAIKQVAAEKGLKTIDAHAPFLYLERLVPDGVHPVAEGQDSLARIIHRAMTAEPVAVRRGRNQAIAAGTRADRKPVAGLLPWLQAWRRIDGREAGMADAGASSP